MLKTALHLQGGFSKTYHAWVYGGPAETAGVIDAPIGRLPLPSLLRQVCSDGKPSLTRYNVLERRGDFTLLALQPVTGRTHQLRVHCAYMGFPILGDPQYGNAASTAFSTRWNLTHQLLCACALELSHPITGERLTLHSRLDATLP